MLQRKIQWILATLFLITTSLAESQTKLQYQISHKGFTIGFISIEVKRNGQNLLLDLKTRPSKSFFVQLFSKGKEERELAIYDLARQGLSPQSLREIRFDKRNRTEKSTEFRWAEGILRLPAGNSKQIISNASYILGKFPLPLFCRSTISKLHLHIVRNGKITRYQYQILDEGMLSIRGKEHTASRFKISQIEKPENHEIYWLDTDRPALPLRIESYRNNRRTIFTLKSLSKLDLLLSLC